MIKHSFLDDYSEGCHPQILDALSSTNLVQQTAYGDDAYCTEARALIKKQLNNPDANVYFVASGTLANLICIAGCLRPHEAVIAAISGHIVQRETGAIEATGHKIISMPSANGKLTPDDVQQALRSNAHFPHMTRPRMVYISNATEFGTVYTKAEVQALSDCCRENKLLLLLDGARLGTALSAATVDLTLADISELTDIFWIGGTKAGALLGEAIVVNRAELNEDFAFHLKQRGALLAKGRLLGLQFRELFDKNLFFDAGRHANQMAALLSDAFKSNGYTLAAATESNQVFPLLPQTVVDKLLESFAFYPWEQRNDGNTVIRMVTSWATRDEHVNAFTDALAAASR